MATTGDVHPVLQLALDSIKPPTKLAGGAELAVHGDAEDVLAQVGAWVGRFGMAARRSSRPGPAGYIHENQWSVRRPPELVADVTDATSLPGPAGMTIDVYPEGGSTPQIPITVRLVRWRLVAHSRLLRWVVTFELEGGD